MVRVFISRRDFIRRERKRPADEQLEDLASNLCQVFIPFEDNGAVLEVAKVTTFEPIKADWRAFNNDLLLSSGAVKPIKTYRGGVTSVLDFISRENLNELFNPSQNASEE